MWAAALDRMITVVRDTFPAAVVYQREGGGTASFLAVFDTAHATLEMDADSGAQVSTTRPMLTMRLADIAFEPHVRDTLTVEGEDYEVVDVQPDGSGMARLVLRGV